MEEVANAHPIPRVGRLLILCYLLIKLAELVTQSAQAWSSGPSELVFFYSLFSFHLFVSGSRLAGRVSSFFLGQHMSVGELIGRVKFRLVEPLLSLFNTRCVHPLSH